MFDSIDLNKNGHIEYKEFVAATIARGLFKDLRLDDENMEIVDIREAEDINIDMYQEDEPMMDMESHSMQPQCHRRKPPVTNLFSNTMHSSGGLNNNQK